MYYIDISNINFHYYMFLILHTKFHNFNIFFSLKNIFHCRLTYS